MYFFKIMDWYTAVVSLFFVAIAEIVAISWCYGKYFINTDIISATLSWEWARPISLNIYLPNGSPHLFAITTKFNSTKHILYFCHINYAEIRPHSFSHIYFPNGSPHLFCLPNLSSQISPYPQILPHISYNYMAAYQLGAVWLSG